MDDSSKNNQIFMLMKKNYNKLHLIDYNKNR